MTPHCGGVVIWMGMFLLYLTEVLKRALTPTARLTDGLQVAAASAIPAIGKVLGVNMPEATEGAILAYIGMAAVSLFVIRMLWAPYSMWKSDKSDIAELKLELTKPERMVFEHMAKLQAKKRLKLSSKVQKLHSLGFPKGDRESVRPEMSKTFVEALHLSQSCGLEANFGSQLGVFSKLCVARLDKTLTQTEDFAALEAIQKYILGSISLSELERQMPQLPEGE